LRAQLGGLSQNTWIDSGLARKGWLVKTEVRGQELKEFNRQDAKDTKNNKNGSHSILSKKFFNPRIPRFLS
jgi:hypothetical protein